MYYLEKSCGDQMMVLASTSALWLPRSFVREVGADLLGNGRCTTGWPALMKLADQIDPCSAMNEMQFGTCAYARHCCVRLSCGTEPAGAQDIHRARRDDRPVCRGAARSCSRASQRRPDPTG